MAKNKHTKAILQAAAIHLLTIIPIEELTEDFQDTAQKLRSGDIDQNTALDYILKQKNNQLEAYVENNEFLNEQVLRK